LNTRYLEHPNYYYDVHSCHGNRIRGVVTLMDDWYRVFNVTDGKLYVAPEKRVKIW
jgi:predicted metalloendopeptidase